MATLGVIGGEIAHGWRRMLLWGIGTALVFQVAMFAALVLRFQALPNYVTFYDWIGNIAWIVRSTPAWSDILAIAREEWLIEIGRMNYDYGTGISEWSLNVIPSRLAVLAAMGAMVALALGLARHERCDMATAVTLRSTAGVGAIAVAMTNATMSWVVCCATPSWVVGLAMMGLGVSTSLALESAGPLLSRFGFGLLLALIVGLAWTRTRRAASERKTAHA